MAPAKDPKAHREEFQAARSTKEAGRLSRRKLPQHRVDESSGGGGAASHHVEEHGPQSQQNPPRDDRAG